MDTFVDLDIVGAMENADKSSCVSMAWDYLRHYECALRDLRDANINLIEIGVQNGNSTRVWKWYFSRAQITGIDINPKCLKAAQKRVKIEIGSQADGPFLDRVCEENPPTIIVDDGSHMSEHIIFSFERMFGKVLPGGFYIVEDIGGFFQDGEADADAETGAKNGEERPAGRQVDASYYFLELARQNLAGRPIDATITIPKPILRWVDEITIIKRAVIIRKRHVARDIPRAIATGEAYLRTIKRPLAMRDHLAAYAAEHKGPPELVGALLKSTIDTNGAGVLRLLLRAENLVRTGQRDEAMQVLREAGACPPVGHLVMVRLARLQRSLGDVEGALRSAEAALEQRPKHGNYVDLVAGLKASLAEARAPAA
jgi:hypothetical protein